MTDTIQQGTVVSSRFLIEAVIGRGGMATVYRAMDQHLGRPVALKVFDALDDSDAARRRAEMHALATLSHPNLVSLFDAELGTQHPNYLVMELVNGPSLREAISKGMSGPAIAEVAIGVSKALGAVHAAGLVHRDIKPANVLLAPTDEPNAPIRAKLVDFGIAHLLGSSRITRRDSIIGTGEYLAPEQISGLEVGPASDIYSFGLLLLECFTGAAAYPGSTPEAILVRMQRDPRVPESVPPRWAQLIREMTGRDASGRPDARTVTEIAIALSPDIRLWGARDAKPAQTITLAMTAPMSSPEVSAATVRTQTDSWASLEMVDAGAGGTDPPRFARRPAILIGAATAVAVLIACLFIGGSNLFAPGAPTPGPAGSPTPSVTPTPVVTTAATTPAPPANNGKGHGNGNGKGHKAP